MADPTAVGSVCFLVRNKRFSCCVAAASPLPAGYGILAAGVASASTSPSTSAASAAAHKTPALTGFLHERHHGPRPLGVDALEVVALVRDDKLELQSQNNEQRGRGKNFAALVGRNEARGGPEPTVGRGRGQASENPHHRNRPLLYKGKQQKMTACNPKVKMDGGREPYDCCHLDGESCVILRWRVCATRY